MTGTLSPCVFTVFDNSGLIVSGAKVFTYISGSATKQNTYTTALLSVANSNPVVADSAGRVTMFLDPSLPNYDIVVCAANSADPPTSPLYTLTNISADSSSGTGGDITVTAGENITAGQWCYLSTDGSGGKTAGKWYLADADFTYASRDATNLGVATADIASNATGTIRTSGLYTAASGLTAGTTYYISATAGALTATEPPNGRAVCTAYSTTAYSISLWQRPLVPILNATDRFVTGGETISAGQTVYMASGFDGGKTAGYWYKADADTDYTSAAAGSSPQSIGIAVSSFTAGTTGYVRTSGIYITSGLTAGYPYYVGSTAGSLVTPDYGLAYQTLIGSAISSTALLISPQIFTTQRRLYQIFGFTRGASMVRTVCDVSTAGNVNANPTTLHTTTITGSTTLNGDVMHYVAKGYFAANNTAKTISVVYSGSGGVTTMTVLNAVGAATNAANWTIDFWFAKTGAASQNCWAQIAYGVAGAAAVVNILAVASASNNLDSAQTLDILATGGASNDIVQNFSTLRAV